MSRRLGSIRWVLAAVMVCAMCGPAAALTVRSTVFDHQGMIPVKYTGLGKDISPPLSWKDTPAKTVTFALICEDPDAPMGTWVHWVAYNIPAASAALPEGIARQGVLADGTKQGKNDFGMIGYGGPLPPPGKAHRYIFTLYALDTKLLLPAGVSRQELLNAMKGHVLGQAQLTGLFRAAQ